MLWSIHLSKDISCMVLIVLIGNCLSNIYIYIKWTCDDGNAIVVWILGLLVSFIFSHFDGIGVTFFRHNCLV